MTVSRDLARDGWSWSLSDVTLAVSSDCGTIDTAVYCGSAKANTFRQTPTNLNSDSRFVFLSFVLFLAD